MPFKVEDSVSDGDFNAISRCMFDSFDEPDCKLRQLYFPILGEGTEGRDRAIEETAKTLAGWHHEDPTSKWIRIVDEDTGRLAGAALWHIYETNPYTDPNEKHEAEGFPVGEDREFANKLMDQFFHCRQNYMPTPHAFLDIFFTHQDFRRRGAAKLMLDWGITRADEKNLEAYLDATEMGRKQYRKWGFIDAPTHEFTLDVIPQSPRHKVLEEQLLPFQWWPMYRPEGGKFVDGRDKLPWAKA